MFVFYDTANAIGISSEKYRKFKQQFLDNTYSQHVR